MYVSLATAALTRIPVGVGCSSDADPHRPTRRGFDANDNTPSPPRRKSSPNQSGPVPAPRQVPWLSPKYDTSYGSAADVEFEERIKLSKDQSLSRRMQKKRSNLEQFTMIHKLLKRRRTLALAQSVTQSEQTEASSRKLSEEQRATFQSRLKQFEATLPFSPKDSMAHEGAALTLAELGESAKAASRLEELLKVKPDDPEVYRLLAEVKFKLRDFEGSVAAESTTVSSASSLSD